MGEYSKRLLKHWRLLGFVPLPYIWKGVEWVGENLLADSVVTAIRQHWSDLPDAPVWVVALLGSPLAAVAVIACVVVASSAVAAYFETRKALLLKAGTGELPADRGDRIRELVSDQPAISAETRSLSQSSPLSVSVDFSGGGDVSCRIVVSRIPAKVAVKARVVQPSSLFKIERWYDVETVELDEEREATVELMHVAGDSRGGRSIYVYLTGAGNGRSFVEAQTLPEPDMEPLLLDVRFVTESIDETKRIRVIHIPDHDFYGTERLGRFRVESVSVNDSSATAAVDAPRTPAQQPESSVDMTWAADTCTRIAFLNQMKERVGAARVVVTDAKRFSERHQDYIDAGLDMTLFPAELKDGGREAMPERPLLFEFVNCISGGNLEIRVNSNGGNRVLKLDSGRWKVSFRATWNEREERMFEAEFSWATETNKPQAISFVPSRLLK